MTMPINSLQDILDAMEHDPALRDALRLHVLTQELLQLPAQFVLLREDVTNIQGRMNRVEGRLGNIEGNQYEGRAANRILARATTLGIQGAQITFSKTGQTRQNFHDAKDMAVQTSLISQDQFYDLLEADLIIRGRKSHAVVEISLGPDADDITRVLRGSGILHKATTDLVTAVVATPDPHPAFMEQAHAKSVHVLDIPT